MPDCGNGEPCERIYHFVLPRILCHGGRRRRDLQNDAYLANYFEGHYYEVGTLPMLFGFHALGGDAQSVMSLFSSQADASHFVYVVPEGYNQSFNGGECCGWARDNNIDDLGFVSHLQYIMTKEFEFLQQKFSFGVGLGNGGFLLTHMMQLNPQLFRGIVPLGGHTHQTDLVRSRMVGDIGSAGIDVMIHHSLDDEMVRPSGCCEEPNMPACEADVTSDSCVSILEIFDQWADRINSCGNASADYEFEGFFGTYILGGPIGTSYALSYQKDVRSILFTLFSMRTTTLYESKMPITVSYEDRYDDKVTCFSAHSNECRGETTLCVYTSSGDFQDTNLKRGSVQNIFDFLSGSACNGAHGLWDTIPGENGAPDETLCACDISANSRYGGTFCYDEMNHDGTFVDQDLNSHEFEGQFDAGMSPDVSEGHPPIEPVSNIPPPPSQSEPEPIESSKILEDHSESNGVDEQYHELLNNQPDDLEEDQNGPDQEVPASPGSPEATTGPSPDPLTGSDSDFSSGARIQNSLDSSEGVPRRHHGHHVIYNTILISLVLVIILGFLYKRRRRWKDDANHERRPSSQTFDEVDFSGTNPYRDYFHRQFSGERRESEEIGISKEDTDLVKRYVNDSDDNILGGMVPSRSSSTELDSAEIQSINERYEMFLSDPNFATASSSSFGSSLGDLSAKSASTVPESLLNIVNSPASYLDPADRRLLRRYRQKEKETILRRSSSDSDDEEEQASVSNSVSSHNSSVQEFKSIKEELQDDLNCIERNAHSFSTSSAEMI